MSNLEKMYAMQQIRPSTGSENVCHSALLRCTNGSVNYVLNLSHSHGKYIGDHAQIHVKDGKEAKFGNCSAWNGPCMARLGDWYNGNEEDLVFDEKTLKLEGSVQKDSGFMVCVSGCGIITAWTSGQLLKPYRPWKTYPDIVVFQSKKRPGVCFDDKANVRMTKGDMHTNDTTAKELLKLNPSFLSQLCKDKNSLFLDFYLMAGTLTLAGKELRPVVMEMIKHFREGDGTDYSNKTLAEYIKKNKKTIQYKNTLEEILKYEIKKVQGDLNKLDTEEINLYIQNTAEFPNYEKGEMFKGLFIAIHAMWGNDVTIKAFRLRDNWYKGIISIRFFDHFGLGEEDMLNKKRRFGLLISDLPGMRAWYTLQHWDRFSGKYKPFVNYSTVEYEFSGSLTDDTYDYVEEEIRKLKMDEDGQTKKNDTKK